VYKATLRTPTIPWRIFKGRHLQLVSYTAELSDQFLTLGRAMRAESSFRDDPWDDNKVQQRCEHPQSFCMGVVTNEGELIAFFLGYIAPQFFGSGLVASDLAMYVKPEHRGAMHFVRLVRAFERWAKLRGARVCTLGQSTGVAIERTRKLFEGLGYITTGASTRKRI
jgi:GNAT superfamily N-acetyltransferase